VVASLAALGSVIAASSCCLPLLPFLFAAGAAGTSAFVTLLRPYLLALSVLLIAFEFYKSWPAKQCNCRPSRISTFLLWFSAIVVFVFIFGGLSGGFWGRVLLLRRTLDTQGPAAYRQFFFWRSYASEDNVQRFSILYPCRYNAIPHLSLLPAGGAQSRQRPRIRVPSLRHFSFTLEECLRESKVSLAQYSNRVLRFFPFNATANSCAKWTVCVFVRRSPLQSSRRQNSCLEGWKGDFSVCVFVCGRCNLRLFSANCD
jgi:hypothetical protein